MDEIGADDLYEDKLQNAFKELTDEEIGTEIGRMELRVGHPPGGSSAS